MADPTPQDRPIRRNCGTMAEHRRLLNEDPLYVAARNAIENRARTYALRKTQRVGVTRIPVVVHVIFNTQAQNITQAQIDSQIAVLNQDFRMTNLDIGQVPTPFQGVTADARIEFFLATVDPAGAPTNGVERIQTTRSSFDQAGNPIKFAASGGADAWPADTYLNIWVAPALTDGDRALLGYAQFPGGPAATDGVVIIHDAFGTTGTAAAPFNFGRTATHEIGHWLNLFHIWGDDGTGCGGSDEVDDTPNQADENYGCPNFPSVSCNNGPNGDMFMNYMDYTDDACMFMFTPGQVTRMHATLDGPRVSIDPELFLVIGDFGYVAGGWRVERHPRFVARLTAENRADILGFGDAGVWIALSKGNGTFQAPQFIINNFGYTAGGWRVENHPRVLADLTGDGRADIVGFGDAGVWIALNDGNGTFQAPQFVINDFGFSAGGWRVDRHPRLLGDITGDGRADIVAFGNDGVWTAVNNGAGSFHPPAFVLADLGFDAGGWRVDRHPRFLANVRTPGRADIVGFGDDGVWVVLSNGDGTFQPPQLVVGNFGYEAGGWRVERHPRLLVDLTGDGLADIIGFGNAGVWVALNNGAGSFHPPAFVLADFGYDAGGWRVDRHVRLLADLTGDGLPDIVGFGNDGVWVAFGNGNGTFQPPHQVLSNFSFNLGGWRVQRHPRFAADLTGDGRADILGFGDHGVSVALNDGSGGF
jgi:hypothetical protein